MERQFYRPDNPEEEPVALLNLPDGTEFEARRDTASLFNFMGNLAIYNHVFCYDTQDNEVMRSFYIFSFARGYNQLVEYMEENKYPIHGNGIEVGRGDIEAYENAINSYAASEVGRFLNELEEENDDGQL